MAALAKAVVAGNLTRDPETRTTPSGAKCVTFSVAVNRKAKGEDRPSYFDVECWGKQGDFVEQYVRKGDPVIVDGDLEQQRWEAKDGQQRSKIVIKGWNVQSLKQRQQAHDRGFADAQGDIPFSPHGGARRPARNLDDDGDVPF